MPDATIETEAKPSEDEVKVKKVKTKKTRLKRLWREDRTRKKHEAKRQRRKN